MSRVTSALRWSLVAALVALTPGVVEAQARTPQRDYRVAPKLPRNGDPGVISARLTQTVSLLNDAIRMQQEARTEDAIARADGVLYSAYKYLGAAYSGIEIRIHRLSSKHKFLGNDPVLELSRKTIERARNTYVRTAMNTNKAGDAVATVQASRGAISLIEQVLAVGF